MDRRAQMQEMIETGRLNAAVFLLNAKLTFLKFTSKIAAPGQVIPQPELRRGPKRAAATRAVLSPSKIMNAMEVERTALTSVPASVSAPAIAPMPVPARVSVPAAMTMPIPAAAHAPMPMSMVEDEVDSKAGLKSEVQKKTPKLVKIKRPLMGLGLFDENGQLRAAPLERRVVVKRENGGE